MRIRSGERIEPPIMALVRIWDTRVSGPSEEGDRRKAGKLPHCGMSRPDRKWQN